MNSDRFGLCPENCSFKKKFAETKTGFNIRAVIYLAKRHLQCWGLALTFHRSTSRLDAIDVETHGLGPELQFLSNITQLSC